MCRLFPCHSIQVMLSVLLDRIKTSPPANSCCMPILLLVVALSLGLPNFSEKQVWISHTSPQGSLCLSRVIGWCECPLDRSSLMPGYIWECCFTVYFMVDAGSNQHSPPEASLWLGPVVLHPDFMDWTQRTHSS